MGSGQRADAATGTTSGHADQALFDSGTTDKAITTAEESGREEHSGSSRAAATTLDAVMISCLTNTHYHASREDFLVWVHRWLMFNVVVLGAAALIDVFPDEFCVAGAAVSAALDLAFNPSIKARNHAVMRHRYFNLLAETLADKVTTKEAKSTLDELSGDEEPPYQVLLMASRNLAQETVLGRAAHQYMISTWGWITKNLARRPGVTYPTRYLGGPVA